MDWESLLVQPSVLDSLALFMNAKNFRRVSKAFRDSIPPPALEVVVYRPPAREKVYITVHATNYNVMRVRRGMAGLKFCA